MQRPHRLAGWTVPILLALLPRVAGAFTTGARFLTLMDHPRAVAMGRAGAGLADDSRLVGRNPAALSASTRWEGGTCFAVPAADALGACGEAAWGHPWLGSFGAYLYAENAGEFPVKEDQAALPKSGGENREVVAGRFARDIIPTVSVGGTGKLFRQEILSVSSLGAAVDLGGVYRTPVENLQVGLAALNAGPAFRSGSARELPPSEFRIGLGYGLRRRDFPFLAGDAALAVDGALPLEGGFRLHAGAEYVLLELPRWIGWGPELSETARNNSEASFLDEWRRISFAARIGSEIAADRTVLSFGGGAGADGLSLDYSLSIEPIGSASHRMSLRYEWGAPTRKSAADVLYTLKKERMREQKQEIIRKAIDRTSRKFVRQALDQAEYQLGVARDLQAETLGLDSYQSASSLVEQAKSRVKEKQYDDAWILASQALLEALDLNEDLRRAAALSEARSQILAEQKTEAEKADREAKAKGRRGRRKPQAPPKLVEPPATETTVQLDEAQEKRHTEAERFYSKKDFEGAVKIWEEMARQIRGFKPILAGLSKSCRFLGLAAYRSGNYSEAAEWWQRGLKHDPLNPEMKTFLANVETKIETIRSIEAKTR
ncbi:MAG: tetratricopeptide repeat protein [Nitrospirae bacterium]|nr:tetratricopeptide repeat protein [Nitrospirota bacterium]